MNKNSRNKCRN